MRWREQRQAEALDRYWSDLLVDPGATPPAGLDTGWAATVRLLVSLQLPSPSPTFREALRRRLEARGGAATGDTPSPRPLPARPRRYARRVAAGVLGGAALAVALAGGYAGARAVADRVDLPVIRFFQASGRTVESDATAEANGVTVRVTAVEASAFQTAVTLAITVPDPLPARAEIFPGGNGRITTEPDLLGSGWGAQDGRRLDERTVELRLNVGPLPPGTERLTIEIPRLDVTDLEDARPFVRRYEGPWRLTVDTSDLAAVAEGAEPVGGPQRVMDRGVTFEVLSIERDGASLRVKYRMEPPQQGPRSAGNPAVVELSDGSIAVPAVGWSTGDSLEPVSLLFTVPEGLEPVRLRFEPVLRPVREPVSFTLRRTAQGIFAGEVMLGGERQGATLTQEGAYAHLAVQVPADGRYLFTTVTLGGRTEVTLEDGRGNRVTPVHGSAGFRKGEEGRAAPDQVTHDFPIVLGPDVQAVTVTAPGYTEVVAGHWVVPLR